MIYNSTINSVNESEAMSLLENAEDRFEYETIAEATAIVVAEQEANWTRFMKGVGFSELSTIMEGEEVIYEGARLEAFFDKAKAYFKMALNKLAEITKRFIANVEKFVRSNDAFIKKYETQIRNAKFPSDFSFKGYKFNDEVLDKAPVYDLVIREKDADFTKIDSRVEGILSRKESFSREKAEDYLCKGEGDTFAEKVFINFHGGSEKVDITPDSKFMDQQIKIVKNTKGIKESAKKSYTAAHKEVSLIIKRLDDARKKIIKDKDSGLESASKKESAVSLVLGFWKAYSTALNTYHGKYMSALGERNRQAKAICTKAVSYGLKDKGKADRNSMRKSAGMDIKEGFVNTDAFLGAVEFF